MKQVRREHQYHASPRKWHLLACVSAFGMFFANAAWAQQAEQARSDDRTSTTPTPPRINPTGHDIHLTLPLRESGRIIGQITARLGADDSIAVKASDLSAIVRPIVRPEIAAKIESSGDADGMVNAAGLQQAGIELRFDSQAIELEIEMPSSTRAPVQLDLVGAGVPTGEGYPQDSFFSTALNYRASFDYVHESSSRPTGFNAPIVDFQLLGRVGALGYENEFFYDDRVADTVVRQGSRLIYDEPTHFRRWTAGDLFVEATAFQSTPDIAGLSISHLAYDFPSFESAQIRGRQTFSLERPSTVDVQVNGQSVTQLRLHPGFYDLRNFPFESGANDVQLLVQDDTGGRQVLQFDYFYDGTLLAPNEREYYAAAGIRSNLEADQRDYFTDEPLFSGFYRQGLSDRLTLGANLQAAKHARDGGIEATFAPSVGVIYANFGVSDIDGVGKGYAARADYRISYRSKALLPRTFAISLEARSDHFGSIESTIDPHNPYLYTAALRYSRAVSSSLSVNAGFTYSAPRRQNDSAGSASTGLSWVLSAATRVDFTANYDHRSDGDEVSGFVFLRHRFGPRQEVSASYDSRNDLSDLNYSYLSPGGIGSVGASVDLSHHVGGANGQASVTYSAARADLELAHNVNTDDDNAIVSQTTSLRAQGALAFASGKFALGHTVSDAFVILSPHASLHGAQIQVGDLASNTITAESGALGPALVNVSAYDPAVIAYSVPDAPVGYDLGLSSVTVFPARHSGYEVTVGSVNNVIAVGNLLDRAGQPVVLQSGEVINIDNPNAHAIEIFTNRQGRFGASGLAPGRWRIRILTGEPLQYDLVVAPNGDTHIADAGTLQPLTQGGSP